MTTNDRLARLVERVLSTPLPAELFDDLVIHTDDLATEMQKQPVLYATYAVAHGEAQVAIEHARLARDRERSRVAADLRALAKQDGTKLTEAALAEAVSRDDEVQALEDARFERQADANALQVIREALAQKESMLRMLASKARQERDA